jgi:TolB-like protein/Tfp pilus assembly protein PilF
VAIAYVAGSWLLIQVVELLFSIFGLPNEPIRLFVIMLFIGFPLVLVLSWVYEWTPEGLKLERDVDHSAPAARRATRRLDRAIIVVLTLSLGYFAFDKFILDPSRDLEIAERSRQAGVDDARDEARLRLWQQKSIAVLPFASFGTVEEHEVFTEGMHDELLTRLARVPALKVIARTSVMRYRDTDKPAREIGEELDVAMVLEGGVQWSGDNVRVNVKLVDTRSERQIWQEVFFDEVTLETLIAVQSEIASRIAAELGAELSPAEASRLRSQPTTSLEAYNLYIRGRQIQANRNTANLRRAEEAFLEAVDIDPAYAEAWVAVADITRALKMAGADHVDDHFDIRRRAIDRALAIDEELGEAWVSLSVWYHDVDGQFDRAQASCEKAVSVAPNHLPAYLWCTRYIEGAGPAYARQRLAWYYRAGQLDPLSVRPQIRVGVALHGLGQYDEALEQLEHVRRSNPGHADAYMRTGDVHFENGRIAEALQWYREAVRLDPGQGWRLRDLVLVYIALRDYDSIPPVREQMTARLQPGAWFFSWLDTALALDQRNLDELPGALDKIPANLRDQWHMLAFRANVRLIRGDMERAAELWLQAQSEWADPAQWETLIALDQTRLDRLNGCKYAGVLLATGREADGRALLDRATNFYETEFPGMLLDSHRSPGPGWCYLVDAYYNGASFDRAFDYFEQRVAHGHIVYWWNEDVPWWDPVREQERFVALMARMDAMRAEQRDLIRQMDAATGSADQVAER